MKKLLFLLLISVYGYGQPLPSPTYNQTTTNTLKIKTPATVTSVNFLTTIEADAGVAKIDPVLLPLSTATINAINVQDATVIHTTGDETKAGTLTAVSFIKASGTSSQFLKADGSSDGSTYAPLASPFFTGSPAAPDPTTAQGLATKNYADGLVVGMLNDRGSWDASGNLFPATGGSGSGGGIRKGDMWFVSVGGILAGKTVTTGDSFRALTNTPGQTAGNWSVLEANIGYVPANDANVIHVTGNETKAGVLSANNNSTTLQVNGLDLTQSNTGGQVLKGTNATSGTWGMIQNQSTGIGLRMDNSGGTGFFSSASGGTAFGTNLTGIANGFVAMSNSTGSGGGFLYQSGSSSTGPAFQVSVSAVTKLFIDKEGNTTYTPILTATSNGQTLRNVTLNPTFVNGVFTGVVNLALDVQSGSIKIPVPATSAGTFRIITQNTSTQLLESVPSTTFSPNILNGYVSGAGTVSAADTPLQAIQKLNGNNLLKADLASPTFTGDPKAPTATAGDNDLSIANTAFVQASTRPYKSYTANLTQTGTSSPTPVVLENQLPGTWSYLGAGSYRYTLTTPVNIAKFLCPQHSTMSAIEFNGIVYRIYATAATIGPDSVIQLAIKSEDGTTNIDDALLNKAIEFRIYN